MNAVINPPVIQKFRSEVYIICVPEIFHINVSLQKKKIVNRKVTETVESPGTSNEASLCSLLEELKSLDAELNNKSVLKLDK